MNNYGPVPDEKEFDDGDHEQDYRNQHILFERRMVSRMFDFVGHSYFRNLLMGLDMGWALSTRHSGRSGIEPGNQIKQREDYDPDDIDEMPVQS